MSVLIETTIGDLVFDLYTDERPRSSMNFLKLCKIKYYNFCVFHSVRRNFIAQCGDPTGTGRGGESIYSHLYGEQAKYFDLEVKPRIKHKTKGTISFVNNGNDKHGSQFFITLGEGLDFLDGKHTIFGMLAEGFDTLELLNETICDDSHKPYQDVRITHTIILYDPYEDPKGLAIPDRSPEPTKEQLESCRIGADEDLEEEKNKSKDEVRKEIEDKELQIGTKILETVGDIPDTEEKPPENVLFVCKLNPITNADDLKIIFSRFGKIRSCEIIKDQKSGDSLCYGFVEFKEVEACEKAYFKMDNVLIDDRRIHVDFCQSISKVKKWHKSSTYQTNIKQPPVAETYELKATKGTKKDKYSMVFEEEPIVSTKHKKKQSRDPIKEKVKKKYESETEDEVPVVVKKSSEIKSKKVVKESRKRKNSMSSQSESEDEPPREVKSKRKSDVSTKERVEVKKKVKKEKLHESDISSDEYEYSKKDRKRKSDEKKPDHKIEEVKSRKKSQKKDKKNRNSESEEELEKVNVYKAKKKKKVEEYISESDEGGSNTHHIKKSSKREKYPEKKKKKTHESDEESDGKTFRDSKQKTHSKKSKSNKSKSRSFEESDTEDYGDSNEKEPSRKKRTHYSSDESSEEEHNKSSKVSRSTHHPDSTDDDRKKKSHKKLQNKKKTRKRHDSSESQSSD